MVKGIRLRAFGTGDALNDDMQREAARMNARSDIRIARALDARRAQIKAAKRRAKHRLIDNIIKESILLGFFHRLFGRHL